MSSGYPYWSESELADLAAAARRFYVRCYKREVRRSFSHAERESAADVRELFEETDCLRSLRREADRWQRHPRLLRAARFLTSPVISDGVFKLRNLQQAQDDGLLIIFDHDLGALARLMAASGRPRAQMS